MLVNCVRGAARLTLIGRMPGPTSWKPSGAERPKLFGRIVSKERQGLEHSWIATSNPEITPWTAGTRSSSCSQPGLGHSLLQRCSSSRPWKMALVAALDQRHTTASQRDRHTRPTRPGDEHKRADPLTSRSPEAGLHPLPEPCHAAMALCHCRHECDHGGAAHRIPHASQDELRARLPAPWSECSWQPD